MGCDHAKVCERWTVQQRQHAIRYEARMQEHDGVAVSVLTISN